jgi:hypothetical protein
VIDEGIKDKIVFNVEAARHRLNIGSRRRRNAVPGTLGDLENAALVARATSLLTDALKELTIIVGRNNETAQRIVSESLFRDGSKVLFSRCNFDVRSNRSCHGAGPTLLTMSLLDEPVHFGASTSKHG